MKNQIQQFLSIAALIIIPTYLTAQDPDIIWQKTVGGAEDDILHQVRHTADGGAILGGTSLSSISYDKTANITGGVAGYEDYWVVKLDNTGAIQWQNTIGGKSDDFLTCVEPTADGGYIIGGYSNSTATGDKTETHFIGGTYQYDYWVLKLNAAGNIEWQNTIGGTADDYLIDLAITPDGGYILGGYSFSNAAGDKAEPSKGGADFWIVKLGAIGNIEWQNTIGGDSYEYFSSVATTLDGGYIISGTTYSPVSDDITEGVFNGPDYLVMKLNSVGNIIWQNTIGAEGFDFAADIVETADGNFIVAGKSDSDVSGDKTEESNPETYFAYDYWVLKLNSTGAILSQNTIGGDEDDEPFEIELLPDGYLIGGFSTSPFTGDLWQATNSLDFWLIKLNDDLNIVWQYIIGGNSTDRYCSFDLNDSGEIVIGGESESIVSGDKTEACYVVGKSDYWALKLAPEDCIPQPLYTDFDHDTYGTNDGVTYWNACVGTSYASLFTTDCNDNNDLINPGQIDICDGFDNNCSGDIDEDIVDCNPGPGIEFQNTIGGYRDDYLQTIANTSDGGYILGGYSFSGISADKTETNWDADANYADYWVVKTNAALEVEWDNTIGGDGSDILYSILQTPDGGYILAGTSSSPMNGDKSEPSLGAGTNNDYWVIKLNNAGAIEWQNTIGGSGTDYLRDIDITTDGGYILGGYSSSPADYDKTEPVIGGGSGSDYWIIKLNATGNIIWQNTIGGTAYDYLQSIEQTTDGGYILGGYSSSSVSGDKTEYVGSYDYWIVKIDATGTIEWQNTIGGAGSDELKKIIQTADGGYLAGGHSSSMAGYDKSEDVVGLATAHPDYWVVKMDATGNIEWDNTIGGTNNDYLTDVIQTFDGNYFLGGYSNSEPSGDKIEINFFIANFWVGGNSDYWVLQLDDSGDIIWQNTIAGGEDDQLRAVTQSADGSLVFGGYSQSDLYYDKDESYMHYYANDDYFDYWILKFYQDCLPVAETCNSLDDNCNGLIDDGITETIAISAGGPITFCQGGTVLLTATYSGTSVLWKKNGTNIPGATSPTYTVTTKGNYSCVTTSDCGTAESTTIFVNVIKNPNASISAGGPTTFCAGGSVVLTEVAVAGCSYQWYKGASPIAGATSLTYTATTAGNYKCRVTK
ncbi:MAG: MopE-related protein, partial [Chitinophagales bacterium]